MVEVDGTVEVVGPDGPVPLSDLFQGRDELVTYQHMWYDGAPPQGQCEGCTAAAWHIRDAVYLNARGVSFAFLTAGRWDEVAPFVEFMGYTEPWYSVRGAESPVGGGMGHLSAFLLEGDHVFLTYPTTGRGIEAANGTCGLLDITPLGRDEAWEDRPGAGRRGTTRAGTGARTRTGTPPGVRPAVRRRSGPGPGRRPWRRSADRVGSAEGPSAVPGLSEPKRPGTAERVVPGRR